MATSLAPACGIVANKDVAQAVGVIIGGGRLHPTLYKNIKTCKPLHDHNDKIDDTVVYILVHTR